MFAVVCGPKIQTHNEAALLPSALEVPPLKTEATSLEGIAKVTGYILILIMIVCFVSFLLKLKCVKLKYLQNLSTR